MNQKVLSQVSKELERTVVRSELDRKLLEDILEDEGIQGLIGEYCNEDPEQGSEEAWSLLTEAVNNRLQLMRKAVFRVKGGEEEESAQEAHQLLNAALNYFFFVSPKTTAMQKATSDFFEQLANQSPSVVQFRDRALGGRTLAPDEARDLIGSYAARFLPLEWFLDLEIPVVGHTSKIVGEYDWGSHRDRIDHRVTIRVDPPGIAKRVRYAHPDTPVLDEDHICTWYVLEGSSGAVVPPYDAELPGVPKDPRSSSRSVELLKDSWETRPILLANTVLANYQDPIRPWSVWPGSVVDTLYLLAEELADAFCWPGQNTGAELGRWWRKDAAAEFVLTGKAPLMRPIDARLYKGGKYQNRPRRIQLDISPWVSVEEVAQAYKRIQKVVVEGRNRLPDPKALKVACFVWKQIRLHGYSRPSWRVLCERWNEENSEHRFKSWRHFRTSFERADKAVKELNFDRPWRDEGGPSEK